MFFVILENRAYSQHIPGEPYPRFPLLQDVYGALALFDSRYDADMTADKTPFGHQGWYEVYDLDSSE